MKQGEQILLDQSGSSKKMHPNIKVENTKNKWSTVLSEYYIRRVELGRSIRILFISAKKLEGLSSITLDNYHLELSMFADTVKRRLRT